ncbi:MAG TPA: arginine--tRNA ligase, partial [Sphingobacterium sp.]|nr:arginine--tRNA ligase [Sphingobacterium sp.]
LPVAIASYERVLIQQVGAFPEAIEASAQEFIPAQLENNINEVAKFYNKFYHEETILKAEDPDVKNFRLHLSASAAKVIAKGMNLLGIHVPERM